MERLWELIEADFATLKRECKIEHPCKMQTLERVREHFEDLEELYLFLSGGQEKSSNKYEEQNEDEVDEFDRVLRQQWGNQRGEEKRADSEST